MRILTVANVAPDPSAGAAGTEIRTIDSLRALGHEVDAIWADSLRRRIAHGNLHYLFELPRTIRDVVADSVSRKHYDVLHINQPYGWLAAKWLRSEVPRIRPLFIHRSHGFEPLADSVVRSWQKTLGGDSRSLPRRVASGMIRRLLLRSSRKIARFADGHVVSTTLDAQALIRDFAVDAARVAIIPQAAPDEYIEDAAPAMTAERLQRVLYVGQFAFFKAPMMIASAMRRLVATRHVTWVCARAHHEHIRELVGSDVTLLDSMSPAQLRAVYDAHGVFLFPSFYEGFGKTFLEAMSRGLCVIATDVGGAHDVIQHGRNGLLVPPGSPDSIVRAVLDLDLPVALEMSQHAAIAARMYSWNRVAQELVDFYEARLAARR